MDLSSRLAHPEPVGQVGRLKYQPASGRLGLAVSVVVPTFNEAINVEELVRRIGIALDGIGWELIFVDDDSPDGTADVVRTMAQQDLRIRCLQRIGRRGLSSACLEGMLASSAPLIAVMDGDLQHDERILPRMIGVLRSGDADVAVGSRYTAGGSTGEWDQTRLAMSRLATRLGRALLRSDLADPMSGFFMIRRDALMPLVGRTSGVGFKILLDLLATSPEPLRTVEIPYEFRYRRGGLSKFDSQALWQFLMMLIDKTVGHLLPVRFIAFCLVGGSGVLVHFLVIGLAFRVIGLGFVPAQAIATLVAMTSNFLLNNALTYRDRRLRGLGLLRGWLSFTFACSIGAIANVGVAGYLFRGEVSWVLSALAGILVGTVWNYAVTSSYTWKTAGR